MGEARRRRRSGGSSPCAAAAASDGIDLLLVDDLVVRNLLADALEDLATRGWAVERDGQWILTDDGKRSVLSAGASP
jgi:hypothetical protein